jgi:serine/threonine-protein kinase
LHRGTIIPAAHIYDFGVEGHDGLRWIAMELVHGIALKDWLQLHGPMPLEKLVPFFELIAEVVQVAHNLGIIHRDLKPSNVMVIESAGRLLPKLLDFGIAKVHHEASPPTPQIRQDSAAAEITPPWQVPSDSRSGLLASIGRLTPSSFSISGKDDAACIRTQSR